MHEYLLDTFIFYLSLITGTLKISLFFLVLIRVKAFCHFFL